jgi:hypothetical protein
MHQLAEEYIWIELNHLPQDQLFLELFIARDLEFVQKMNFDVMLENVLH